ncbi:MAG: NAD(P)/FAD-dependent oxidoreductase [Alicyclobacillaceae bacterium]|nr:NAD(P)/FAD-dependent oxidoreductase [Alicyclobacillaceae bacterium]
MEQIVILGAGYGGVMAAQGLQRRHIPYILINEQPYHQFTTLMHEVAGGGEHVEDYRIALADLVDPDFGTLRVARVTGIDQKKRRVHLEDGAVDYDVLIVALGSETEFFGIPGLKEHSLQLWGFESALAIRQRVENIVKTAKGKNARRIVIGGGGLTGVELAGELAEWVPKLCLSQGVPRDAVPIVLLEAMDTILPMLDVTLQRQALHILREKGVDVRTQAKLIEVKSGQVVIEGTPPLEYALLIWTGGVRGNAVLGESGFEIDRKGRVPVDATLRPPGERRVFVIGDCAAFPGPDGRPLPPTAQLATQMGQHAAENVDRLLHGRSLTPFRPHLRGTLASLGAMDGIGEIGAWKLTGAAARFLKEANKARYLWNIGGWKALSQKRGQIRWA